MPNLRLTRRAIDEISYPVSGQVFYRDTTLTGFGLRVGTQSKVYYAEGQVPYPHAHQTPRKVLLSVMPFRVRWGDWGLALEGLRAAAPVEM